LPTKRAIALRQSALSVADCHMGNPFLYRIFKYNWLFFKDSLRLTYKSLNIILISSYYHRIVTSWYLYVSIRYDAIDEALFYHWFFDQSTSPNKFLR